MSSITIFLVFLVLNLVVVQGQSEYDDISLLLSLFKIPEFLV